MNKIITILTILIFTIAAQAEDITLDTLSAIFAQKFNKTLVIDKEISKDFKLITNRKLINDFKESDYLALLKISGYDYRSSKKFYYIYKQKEEKEDNGKEKEDNGKEDKEYYEEKILDIKLSKNKVKQICEIFNYKCTRIDSSKYLVISEKHKINTKAFKSSGRKTQKLQIEIYELYDTELKDRNVNLSAVFNKLTLGQNINTSLLGSIGQVFGDTQNGVTVQAFINYLDKNELSELITSPTLILDDGITHKFFAGENLTVKSGSVVNAETGQVTDSYTNVQVGLNVQVETTIYNDVTEVNLKLDLSQISSINTESQTVNTNSRTMESTFFLKKGETKTAIAFTSDVFVDSGWKVPGLSNVWVVGGLFDYTSKQKQKRTIFIKLTLL